MPRTSKSWSYEASKRRYVANINKEKIILLEQVERSKANDEIADEKYARARAIMSVQVTGDRTPISISLSAWLRWIQHRPTDPVSLNTFTRYQSLICTFTDMHGDVLGRDITAWHIEDWLARMRQGKKHPTTGQFMRWEDGTVRVAITAMRAAFSYCAGRRLISSNPFEQPDAINLRKTPAIDYEGKRLAIEQQEYEALVSRGLTRSCKDWAILCMLLWDTGARPSELMAARIEEWDARENAIVIDHADPANMGRFKLRRKKKNRVIYVSDEMVPFVELLMEKYKNGPLWPANYHQIAYARERGLPEPAPMRGVSFIFRMEQNRTRGPAEETALGPPPFTPRCFSSRMQRTARAINEEAGEVVVREELSAYGFRHAYATRWIVTNHGNELKILAQLMGTSLLMIEKHYSGLFRKHDVLRDRLNAFRQKEGRDP